jgi:hypothetical protein
LATTSTSASSPSDPGSILFETSYRCRLHNRRRIMATTLIIFNNQQQSAHTRGGAASTLNFADESGA